MSIFKFVGLTSWSPDVRETEEHTKWPWVEAVGLIVSGWRGGKNKETVAAFLQLLLVTLVAPAMTTPDWSQEQQSSSVH